MVRNSMVEALWTDCENRAKAIGDLATRYYRDNKLVDDY